MTRWPAMLKRRTLAEYLDISEAAMLKFETKRKAKP